MSLIEREHELRLLEKLRQECLRGKGSSVVMSGPVACGKTALLQAVEEQATDAEWLVLSANGSYEEQALPFSVMAQVFEPIALDPRYAPHVEEILGLKRCFDLSAEPAAREAKRHSAPIYQALWRLLGMVAAERPVLILIDDVHAADEVSQWGLLFLARRLRSSRILLAITEQADPFQRNRLFRVNLLRQRHCHRLWLAPLSEHSVTLMIANVLGEAEGRRLGPLCHAAVNGNPLLVEALLADGMAAERSVTGPETELCFGHAYREAVLACLHRSTPMLRAVACAEAVLGEATPPDLIGKVIGVTPETVKQAQEALGHIGLSARFLVRAARRAVLDHTSPQEREQLHVRAAAILQDEHARPEAVAQHLLEVTGTLPPWATGVLRAAADTAVDDGDTALAIACLQRAWKLEGDEQERGSIMALLTSLEWRSDPSIALRLVPKLASIAQFGNLHQSDAAVFLRHLLWGGHFSQAEELLGRFDKLPGVRDSASVEFLRAWVAYSYPKLAHLVPASEEVPRQRPDLEASLHVGAAQVLFSALEGRLDDTVVDRAQLLLESHQLTDFSLEPLTAVLTALVDADEVSLASGWCDRFLDQAEKQGAPTWLAVMTSLQASVLLAQGDLHGAKARVLQSFDHVQPAHWGTWIGWPLMLLLRTSTELGELDEAAGLIKHPVPATMFQTRFGLHYLHARGLYFYATGRPHAAKEDFKLCGELAIEWQIDLPGLVPWRTGLAQTYLALGREEPARQLLESQLKRTTAKQSRSRAQALRVLASIALPAEQNALLTEAALAFSSVGDRQGAAEILAELQRRGAPHLRPCSAPPLPYVEEAHVTSRDPVHDGPAASPAEVLSPAEQRVAGLVAQGRTNRQISQELFITISTVEQHLTRAFRKLNVGRRSELASLYKYPDIASVGRHGLP
jgi:DNA-binding CsgD family transcriptional regulator/tetratricopeptide (TPR) repeat protein